MMYINCLVEGQYDKARKIKRRPKFRKEEKLSIFTHGMIVYIENPVESIQNYLN